MEGALNAEACGLRRHVPMPMLWLPSTCPPAGTGGDI